MSTPAAWMTTAHVAFVGLNPRYDGGPAVTLWDFPAGNAYALQPWGLNGQLNVLQKQVAGLFDAINVVHQDVFAAQFVPFKSTKWDTLARPNDALAFGRLMWQWVLSHTTVTRFFCLGRAASEIAALTGAVLDSGQFPTGWGNTLFKRYVSPRGIIVVGMPHLSRFQLFNRKRFNRPNFSNADVVRAINDAGRP
jgi:hypothetical protein